MAELNPITIHESVRFSSISGGNPPKIRRHSTHCADAFVFPSVQEGWGLVLLEAIASGLPVLTSNQPPFTEFLAPDQAILIDPQDIDEITQGMLQIINPKISQELVTASAEIPQQFSWGKSAQIQLNYYSDRK
ncbi:MAG: glycosyltransferase [Oscillatoriales cyanobacterium RM2_1_1]|nr:glycosyltransferase [Oscillatoriales cyanobacterium SM2_3_0]NJO46994.1 glycosyltransferase [Oscillatoriales cyanobacterium RM2_1_1]